MTDDEDAVTAAAWDALDRGLITEQDIDRAVGSSMLGRFRLGEFDGDACFIIQSRRKPTPPSTVR